jgi:hypothetical protein
MKEQMLLRPHLLNKFDELPVNGNGVADWKRMEKALQIAMPIGLLSFILFGKGWLLSKKLMWLWISIATCGGAATTLAVYQSRQASLVPASPLVNKPNRGNSASHVLPAVSDTTIRVSKKNKTKKVLRNAAGTSAIKLKKSILNDNDTVVRPTRTPIDAYSRLRNNLRPARTITDTYLRLRNTLRPARNVRDTPSVSLLRNPRLVRTVREISSVSLLNNLRPARTRDTSARLLRNLRPARIVRDTSVRSLKISRPARTVRATSIRPLKSLKPARTVRDTSVRLLKNPRPARIVKDTLVRPAKKLNVRPANP